MSAAIVLLALVESVSALVAPLLAPTDADWRAAAKRVRAGFKPGDLIVAAPAWSDPLMRMHLGDLVPLPVAARIDEGRFARVWEISQRGASAPESDRDRGATLSDESRHGALRVRLFQRPGLPVTYDFVESWAKAKVLRREPGRGEIACERLMDKFQCPHIGFNFVKRRLLEIGSTNRLALYAQPVQGAAVVAEYADVPLGRELAVGGGLHSVWLRKGGEGTVWLRVLVDGKEVGKFESGNSTGWKVVRFDTSPFRGRKATVRFEITSEKAYSRHFGFAAEARGP